MENTNEEKIDRGWSSFKFQIRLVSNISS